MFEGIDWNQGMWSNEEIQLLKANISAYLKVMQGSSLLLTNICTSLNNISLI